MSGISIWFLIPPRRLARN